MSERADSLSLQGLTASLAGLARRLLRRVGIAAPGGIAAALAVALITYNPADPSLNVASDAPVSNLLGQPGAIVADVLLRALGMAAFVLVPVLAGWSWRLVRAGLPSRSWLRAAVLPPALLLLATGLAALPNPTSWPMSDGLGGAAGHLTFANTAAALPWPGWLTALISGISGVALAGYALGWSRAEWAAVGRAAAWVSARGLGTVQPADAETKAERKANREARRAERAERRAERKAMRQAKRDTRKQDREARGKQRREPVLVGGGEPETEAEAAPAPAADPEPEPAKKAKKAATKAEPEPESDTEAERTAAVEPRAAPEPPARTGGGSVSQAEDFEMPPLKLLTEPEQSGKGGADEDELQDTARQLEKVLGDFGVKGEIVKVRPGPVVTRYDLEPAPGTKNSRVIGLAGDIARAMAAVSVRVAVVPGTSVIGIELPNAEREIVFLRELLASREYVEKGGSLPLTLGKDISGSPTVVDLAKMPHLLVAGTTGSGKSVAINAMLLSLMYRLPPEQCRMILIDPKMLELSVYEDIPHLMAPVVTDPKKAVTALKWTVREMEDRYRKMARLGVRNIDGYNARIHEANANGEILTRRVQTGFDPDSGAPVYEEQDVDMRPLPYIVVVVDEMADLMQVAGKDIEMAAQRLAQMARAAGIHLIMATQRPSVDVITGTLKANFPTRISFHVTSKVDSRTILGETGAEQLLGKGDMLYMAHGGRVTRVHGPLVSDDEVEGVVAHLKAQGAPEYDQAVTEEDGEGGGAQDLVPGGGNGGDGGEGDLYEKAVAVVLQHRKASTSFVQRQLQIGYNRAARLIEKMEGEGVVSPANHVGKREILIESQAER
ncbi:DNA translocase FtsK [Limimonas halophila]|uniref:DNA translocase FtsK n=1 Tax=Limimonas halophila TaxID=1082479 RepID=A0A1G7SP77_9PROT|nr:DNA translocase FtsK [Limimonas halophila]SDG24865.1 DNA translocase FtsK [Limimonas halophila]